MTLIFLSSSITTLATASSHLRLALIELIKVSIFAGCEKVALAKFRQY